DWLGRVGGYIQEDHGSTTYGKGNGEDAYGAEGISDTVDGIEGSQDRDVDWVAVTKGYTKGYSKGYNKGWSNHQDTPEPESEDDGIPVQPSVFYTMMGEKYHARENCYGLRRLLFVHPGAVRITGDGLWHVLSTCAGRGVTYWPCANCR
ncbi:unnamed protein product, partial [Effrenium voratum]